MDDKTYVEPIPLEEYRLRNAKEQEIIKSLQEENKQLLAKLKENEEYITSRGNIINHLRAKNRNLVINLAKAETTLERVTKKLAKLDKLFD